MGLDRGGQPNRVTRSNSIRIRNSHACESSFCSSNDGRCLAAWGRMLQDLGAENQMFALPDRRPGRCWYCQKSLVKP